MRIIDAEPFDKFIIRVPECVGDEYSYIHGVEDILNMIRNAETIDVAKLHVGEEWDEVKFFHHSDNGREEIPPRCTIECNGDFVIHCGSVDKAKEMIRKIGDIWFKKGGRK